MTNPSPLSVTAKPHLAWCDLETTGLGDDARVIECGIILTDKDANSIAEASWLAYASPRGWEPGAARMHRPESEGGTGLMARAYEATRSFDQLGPTIADWLRSHGVDGVTCKPRVAGNGPHFDRRFLRRDVPMVDALLHHRHRDVSCLLEFFADAGLPLQDARPRPHEALGDLKMAIEHYRAFLATVRMLREVSPGGVCLSGRI